MFPTAPPNSKEDKKLLKYFKSLDDTGKKTLMEFAEFLSQKAGSEIQVVMERQDIPRPETESVIKAIKRLSATYPMIENSSLFNDTSALMTKHVMQGVSAPDIIDELEEIFLKLFNEMSEMTK